MADTISISEARKRRMTKAEKQAIGLIEDRLFDLRTRIVDIAGRDPDLLVYGVRRYWQPQRRSELLRRTLADRTALKELRTPSNLHGKA